MKREALSIFDELVTLDRVARAEQLNALSASDPELHKLVEELLDADQRADAELERVESSLRSVIAKPFDADPLHLVGQTVSHFRVLAPLAAGGMGIVYRAEDTQLKRAIALKFPLPHLFFDPAIRERFLREARLAGALDHPNICPIYEAGETESGQLFYAMPLYDGETLRTRLARIGRLPLTEALHIAKQIALGLDAAHRAGIIHRDLKPANVMVLRDGTVKLLDFGLARSADLRITTSALRLGTAAYMAPEQITGGEVDARTDLWVVGVLLYEMLTGQLPFRGDHDVAVAHAIVQQPPPQLSALRLDLPAYLDDVVLTLLAKEPALRPASAADLHAMLATQTRIPARTPRMKRFTRKVAFSALSLIALVSGAWFATQSLRDVDPRVRMIAVHPMPGAEDADRSLSVGFAAAIASELSRLQGVAASNAASAHVRANLRVIPEPDSALPLSAILRTRVQRSAGGQTYVDLELSDVAQGKRIWAHRYQGVDLQDVERDALRRVADALRLPLAGAERSALQHPSTTIARAYLLYLQGRAAEVSDYPRSVLAAMPVANIREAQSLYSRARDLDPAFAQARARLALMLMHAAARYDTLQARRDQARLEAEAALRLNPNISDAQEALVRYWAWNDPERALAEMEKQVVRTPHNAGARIALGRLYRNAGRWEEAVAEFERAVRLDPADPNPIADAAFTLLRLRRDREAMRHMDRLITLTPDDHMVRVIKGHTYLRWQGNVDTLDAVLRTLPEDWDPDGMTTWARFTSLWVQRRHHDALAMLDATTAVLCFDSYVYQPISLMRAQVYEALGDRAQAQRQYRAAYALLKDSVAARPQDARRRAALALALAGLGREQDAAQEARNSVAHTPLTRSSAAATAFMGIAIEVFARTGDTDAAFELLELLLAMPAGREVTIPYVRLWPGFDGLRSDPRLNTLLARFATQD